MKYLVTGSAGFIGFHLSQRLLAEGYDVVGIDTLNAYYDPVLKHARNEQLLAHPRYSFHIVDITDYAALVALVGAEAPDAIIHLAAQAGVRYSLQDPWIYEQTNVLGTLNVFEAARLHNVTRVVYASSSSVNGANTVMPFAEHHMTDRPISVYAATKKATELLAHTYHHLYGTELAGLRFFTVYGEWSRPDMAMFSFAKDIMNNTPIKLFNHGKMRRDFTHVDDIVAGIIAVVRMPQLRHEIYNLGGDNPIELEHMVALLEKSLGYTATKEYLPMQMGDVEVTYADISKAKKDFGFAPAVGIQEGIARFAAWFLQHKDWLLKLGSGK